nr:hypothetical protein [Lachnospiraceae bacterium]
MINRYSYIIKDMLKWAAALVTAYLLANIALIPYYHYTPGIPLEVNATNEIYYPGSPYFTTQEGYSYGRFDANGYLNYDGKGIGKDYETGNVLLMGSSHTMGKEVPRGCRYCDIINEEYEIPVYNMAMDGHLYPDIVKGFKAALRQFPDPSAIVIETSITEFNIDDLRGSLEQREYDEAHTGEALVSSAGNRARFKSELQTWLPYRILLKQKINALKAEVKEKDTGSEQEYRQALDDTMKLMRSMYDKPIVILYHTSVNVDKTGIAAPAHDNEETVRIFAETCKANDIVFADMSDDFIEEYMESSRLPHGFMNTSVGTGHLNRTGHK